MSSSEKELMKFVWAADGPISSAKLLDDLKTINKEWKPNTVLTFLAHLIEKGILTSIRHGRSNEPYVYISGIVPAHSDWNCERQSFHKYARRSESGASKCADHTQRYDNRSADGRIITTD